MQARWIALTLFTIVAITSIASMSWYGNSEGLEADLALEIESGPADFSASARDPVAASISATTSGDNREASNQERARSIRSLIAVSIVWKKGLASSNPEGMRAFDAAVTNFDVAELVRLAKEEDEPFSARELGIRKSQCVGAPTTREGLEREMSNLKQSRTVSATVTEGDFLATNEEELRLLLQMMESTFEKCSDIRTVLDGDDTDFMKMSADNGNPVAMLDYANSIFSDNSELAKSYMDSAWNSGQASALWVLSNYETSRFERGIDPSADVEAAALLLAFAALEEARIELFGIDPSHPVAQAAVETANGALQRLDALNPYKRDLAIKRAQELIETNDRCCIRLGW